MERQGRAAGTLLLLCAALLQPAVGADTPPELDEGHETVYVDRCAFRALSAASVRSLLTRTMRSLCACWPMGHGADPPEALTGGWCGSWGDEQHVGRHDRPGEAILGDPPSDFVLAYRPTLCSKLTPCRSRWP